LKLISQEELEIYHFGVPGMRWGQRKVRQVSRLEEKVKKLESKGKIGSASRKNEKLKVLKKRLPSTLEVAEIGQRIKDGTNIAQKILMIDRHRMINELKKGNATSGEKAVEAILYQVGLFPFGGSLNQAVAIEGRIRYGTVKNKGE